MTQLPFVGIALVEVDERTVDKARTSGSGIVADDIPAAWVSADGLVKPVPELLPQSAHVLVPLAG